MNIIYDRTRDLIATSGNSALMSITDKPSIASVKAAQYIQAARIDYLTRQYESFLNEMINKNFDLKFQWKISLWGDIFNIREDIKILREQVVSGLEGFIPKLLSANGMTVDDYQQAKAYLKALDIKVEKVLDQENLIANPVGRPKLNDDEITNDNTGNSSNAGTNVSDIKEFSYNIKKCQICGKELNEDEDVICNECLEEMYESRINDMNTFTHMIPKKVKD